MSVRIIYKTNTRALRVAPSLLCNVCRERNRYESFLLATFQAHHKTRPIYIYIPKNPWRRLHGGGDAQSPPPNNLLPQTLAQRCGAHRVPGDAVCCAYVEPPNALDSQSRLSGDVVQNNKIRTYGARLRCGGTTNRWKQHMYHRYVIKLYLEEVFHGALDLEMPGDPSDHTINPFLAPKDQYGVWNLCGIYENFVSFICFCNSDDKCCLFVNNLICSFILFTEIYFQFVFYNFNSHIQIISTIGS